VILTVLLVFIGGSDPAGVFSDISLWYTVIYIIPVGVARFWCLGGKNGSLTPGETGTDQENGLRPPEGKIV